MESRDLFSKDTWGANGIKWHKMEKMEKPLGNSPFYAIGPLRPSRELVWYGMVSDAIVE